MQRVLLSGAPGAGKSSVLGVLRKRGYSVGDDAARDIIRERKSQGLSARPAAPAFARQILDRETAAWGALASSPCFFERGVPDVAGSLLHLGEIDQDGVDDLLVTYPYASPVFLFPPWEAIYCTDDERDEDFDHATRVYASVRDWYERCGYPVYEMPKTSIGERVELLLRAIGQP